MSIQGDSRGPLGSALSIDLNTVGDTFIPINNASYIPRTVTLTNVSTTMAGSSCQVALYTGPGGTGTAIVAAAVITSLTGATVLSDRTIAAATTVFTPVYDSTADRYGIYARVTVAHGAAATCDMHVFGDTLATG